MSSAFYEAVYAVVQRIPKGKVMTYGQIAAYLDNPRAARAVGYALKATGKRPIPWQRVINRHGGISGKDLSERPVIQRKLLEAEGVAFDAEGRCSLKKHLWHPPDRDELNDVPWRELPFKP